MTRVLVVGATGQLGLALQRQALPPAWQLDCLTRADVDLTNTDAIFAALSARKADAIVNASAYTAVDRAETERELAFQLNRDAPAAMAKLGIPFVHVSTDYVFAGDKPTPYVETDERNPISVYGASKAAGEDAVFAATQRAAIVRTAWVYSPDRANFVKTMLRLGAERDEVSVVADQIGTPTSADDLAAACIALTARQLDGASDAFGVFHYAGREEATWADFAEAIFNGAQKRGRRAVGVKRITTAGYPTPAKRPANSRLDTSKIEGLGVRVRPWHEALNDCLDRLL